MSSLKRLIPPATVVALSIGITACNITVSTRYYTLGGSVYGLDSAASVTLVGSAGDSLVVMANGNFTFAKALANGTAYPSRWARNTTVKPER